MTLGIDKLTNDELLKVVIACAEMAQTSIAQVAEKLEKKDLERLVNTIVRHKELWSSKPK